MPKRMLIDSSHPEETRVVVLDGQKVEEFDFEAASKRPLKGNIYLAKVTRVEPSLQAAFVEYGGNRQGFLAFSEIHPDYYQIPVADREALLAETQAEARRHAEEEFELIETASTPPGGNPAELNDAGDGIEDAEEPSSPPSEFAETETVETGVETVVFAESEADVVDQQAIAETNIVLETGTAANDDADDSPVLAEEFAQDVVDEQGAAEAHVVPEHAEQTGHEERPAQALHAPRPSQRWTRRRHYKIQEVIKRRQIILVQVVKEERGNKGAALTTYLSLAGRYCVLMPNTPRGGGISRKITNANDRKRLKSAAASLELPEGMGLIIRTAGESRTKLEIKRDYEYLLRMWDQIRELTLKSNAPACVYEEGDLIKRAIRDLYNKDVSDILVEGEDGYRSAKDFMRMLMPSHAKNVKPYKENVPLFQRFHTEAQLDAMFTPTVTLKSGGYIVINQTEALVAIDVNSGRATREHSIEDTAFKTNLEAADEIARQLRLRDLAGLIVIDFIDMEDSRNDRAVEKRLNAAVKNDRARIQIGKISQFGLLEMSRQRLRAGVIAGSTVPCPHCDGQGIVRSVESTALRLLRALEEEGQKQRASSLNVKAPQDVAIYTLNQKRRELARIENDYGMSVTFTPDAEMHPGHFDFERTAQKNPEDRKAPISVDTGFNAPVDEDVLESSAPEAETAPVAHTASGDGSGTEGSGRKRRRRRRGGRDRDHQTLQEPVPAHSLELAELPPGETEMLDEGEAAHPSGSDPEHEEGQGKKRRRRRRRGRRGRHGESGLHQQQVQDDDAGSVASGGERDGAHIDDAQAESSAAPNAPSGPVWSFASEQPPTEPVLEETPVASSMPEEPEKHASTHQNEAPAPAAPEAVPNPAAEEPAAEENEEETAAVSKEQTPAEPPRKGWWQRRLS